MQLLASWRDSLTLFKPANFKLFGLVTLKKLLETYKVWLKYCWWLIVLFVGLQVWGQRMYVAASMFMAMGPFDIAAGISVGNANSITLLGLINYFTLFFVIILVFLAVRPSMGLKNSYYFIGYVRYMVFLMPWFILLPVIWKGLAHILVLLHTLGVSKYLPSYIHFIWGLFWVCFYFVCMYTITTFFIQFFFDTNGSLVNLFRSLWRGIQMAFYNLPALLIFGLIMLGLYVVFMTLAWPLMLLGDLIMNKVFAVQPMAYWHDIQKVVQSIIDILIFLPFVVCTATTFYVKKLHDQFGVYFK